MPRYYHLLPFEKIERDSKIVLYGAGEVGQWYLEQLQLTGYAEVVAIVDQNWSRYPQMSVPVLSPEKLWLLTFDSVMISIEKQQIAQEVAKTLEEDYEIPADKIILGCNSLCEVPEFLKPGQKRPKHLKHKKAQMSSGGGTEKENPKSAYALPSFAQWGEDVMILKMFQSIGIPKPTYMDVGANHPYMISNTALLHEMGCHGVNIEANPECIEAFRLERPTDININCGVASEKGVLPFYMFDKWSGRNSFSKKTMDDFLKAEHPDAIPEVRYLPVRTLENIVEEIGGVMPDYMDLDVESMEWDVLKNYDLEHNGPKIMTIEIKENREKLLSRIKKGGYFLFLHIRENFTFVKNEYKDMLME